jgi:hypothetical protein
MVHSLRTPSKPGFVLSGSEGCRGFIACPRAGMVCVLHAARATAHAWAGAGTAGADGTGPPPEPSDFRRLASFFFPLAAEAGAAAAAAGGGVGGASGGPVPASSGVVTGAAFVGAGRFSVCIVHPLGRRPVATAVEGAGSEDGGDGAPPAAAPLPPAVVDLAQRFRPFGGRAWGRGEGAAAGAFPFTHGLTYLLLHAWTGRACIEVRAGVAPCPDAAALPSVGAEEGVRSSNTALYAAVGAPAPAKGAPFNWGTLCAVEHAGGGGCAAFAVLPSAGERPDSVAAVAFYVDTVEAATSVECAASSGPATSPLSPAAIAAAALQRLPSLPPSGVPVVYLDAPAPSALASSPDGCDYLLSAHGGGVSVYSSRSGALLQAARVPGLLALAGAGSWECGGKHALLVARTGVVLLRLLPRVAQVAALSSARPPQFEAALALCAGGSTDGNDAAPPHTPPLSPPLPADEGAEGADVEQGVSAARARAICAEYGYSLFHSGDFVGALTALARAGAPLEDVRALFPELLPATGDEPTLPPRGGGLLGGGGGAPSPPGARTRAKSTAPLLPPQVAAPPFSAPQLGGSSSPLLPAALAPFACYLHGLRRDAAQEVGGALEATDSLLLEVLLWLRNSARGRGAGGAAAAVGAHTTMLALLRGDNGLTLPRAALVLCAYGCEAAGEEAAALLWGKQRFPEAIAALAGGAEALLRAAAGGAGGALLRLPAGHELEAAEALRPAYSRTRALLSSLALLPAGSCDALVGDSLAPLLAGGGGVLGLLLALGATMRVRGCGEAAGGESEEEGEDSGGALWGSTREGAASLCTLALGALSFGGGGGVGGRGLLSDTPQLWHLRGALFRGGWRGVCPPSRVLLDGLLLRGGAPWVWGVSGGGEEHTEAIALDAAVLPPPAGGWARHVRAALLEHALLLSVEAARPPPAEVANGLLASYFDALRELGALGCGPPAAAPVDDAGLLREFRARAVFVLRCGGDFDARAALAGAHAAAAAFSGAEERDGAAPPPPPPLAAERALILARLGRHEEALSLLWWGLRDVRAAEDYCIAEAARKGSCAGEGADSVFLTLMRVALRGAEGTAAVEAAAPPAAPPPTAGAPLGSSLLRRLRRAGAPPATPPTPPQEPSTPPARPDAPSLEALILLLCRNAGTSSLVPLLALLPSDKPLALVAPLLVAVADRAAVAAAAAATALSLRAVDHTLAARALVGKQSRHVKMEKNPPAECAICGRRMAAPGTSRPSPAAVYLDGGGRRRLVVCHVACYRE